jgi:hypothetical protein
VIGKTGLGWNEDTRNTREVALKRKPRRPFCLSAIRYLGSGVADSPLSDEHADHSWLTSRKPPELSAG